MNNISQGKSIYWSCIHEDLVDALKYSLQWLMPIKLIINPYCKRWQPNKKQIKKIIDKYSMICSAQWKDLFITDNPDYRVFDPRKKFRGKNPKYIPMWIDKDLLKMKIRRPEIDVINPYTMHHNFTNWSKIKVMGLNK